MKKALVLGRFQPLHTGHAYMFKQLHDKKIELLLIGIGTRSKNEKNPLSYEIRNKMVRNVLHGTNYAIYNIPDIDDPLNYEKHVRRIVREMDDDTLIFSGNPYTTNCFPGYKIEAPKKGASGICATTLRKAIRDDRPWKKYIPSCNLELFEKYNLIKIIKS